ncbi:right-handed parallel beta-helix repeat-containing protein [Acanthopleuribacter pedis]|uniref:Right-handed parallel beta-helix repeat-containing protein n=1 Tax=Acanthopleuribacter pedis TaxID=442870 RepID=A0A8J7QQI3_9BACT|nr:right-handed parallel beta-helix repeat-containing protein [Acanthopleuribacter pedis]MBO1323000.1 right-handed parallel beta-helix repeat-containing protein [Acanthopleuribacter pedis]
MTVRMLAICLMLGAWCHAADLLVAPAGAAYATIQSALNDAQPGDRVVVASGEYREQLVFPRSGTAQARIELIPGDGQAPILDGSDFNGGTMVLMENRSFVSIDGFEIRNLSNINDGSGVRVLGSGQGVQIRNNRIHNLRGNDAMGITVYGTEAEAIRDIVISGNHIYDCDPARSEALVLNGNVDGFQVVDNIVRDVNNIGIDFIGGETSINPNQDLVARNGLCARNTVARANSNYGGGYAAGIYVDGGRDIIIEHNRVTDCDLGIEIGAENAGLVASGIVVRNNWVYRNQKVGIVFGGYDQSVGRVQNCYFLNNTLFENDTLGEGTGEFWIQWASANVIANNLVAAGTQGVWLYSEGGNQGNAVTNNLWDAPARSAATFTWVGQVFEGLSGFQQGTGQGTNGLSRPAGLVDPANFNFHLDFGSAAIDAGDTVYGELLGETDIDGEARIAEQSIDIGADEFESLPGCFYPTCTAWREFGTTLCGETGLRTVLELVSLLNATCPCP